MQASFRARALGATVGALALAMTAAVGTAGATALKAGIQDQSSAQRNLEARSLTFPPTVHDCWKLDAIRCYTPAQLRAAYDLAPLYADGNDGTGQTVAIIDSFGSPTIQSDLDVFSDTYGLPHTTVDTIAPSGPIPPFDPTNPDMIGWAQESTLDVEAVHLVAPGAHILLVETPVAETEGVTGFPEMINAENFVIDNHLANVITQSFGATEQSFADPGDLLALRSAYMNAAANGVTVMASTGDGGTANAMADGSCCFPFPTVNWPASDPLVTAVGGTLLTLNQSGARIKPDNAWGDAFGATGGGVSAIFDRPDYQAGLAVKGTGRAIPDISMSAAVKGAMIVYYSFQPGRVGFHLFGGTSEASPLFAGVVALAAQRVGHGLGPINAALYAMAGHAGSGIVDVIGRSNAASFIDSGGNLVNVRGWFAHKGYDLSTGLGTVDAAQFVPALAAAAGGGS
jgi:subtilase family serine protease